MGAWVGFCSNGLLAERPGSAPEAIERYRRAAEQGDAYAQYFLGGAYLNGPGVARD